MADERSQSEKTAEQSAQRGSSSEHQKKIDNATAPHDREGKSGGAGQTGGTTK